MNVPIARVRSGLHQASREPIALLIWLGRWCVLGAGAGILSGIASAGFLFALDWATDTREQHRWLLWLLPVGGAAIGWIYSRFGRDVEGGSDLLFERIQEPGAPVSWKMAPLIALATVGTHLFGGSAGREGTAVQMGGSLADLLGRPLGLDQAGRRLLLSAGVAGGFGSVFGTPLAGAVFALEVLAIGRLRHDALVPCLVAATVGDFVAEALGVIHQTDRVAGLAPASPWFLLAMVPAGLIFGLAATGFAELTRAIRLTIAARVRRPWLRPALGGLAVVGLTEMLGTREYLGLSIPLILRSFDPGGVPTYAFAWKLLFTAITLGSGFKGGEVTPLFAIGAALGATLAAATGLPGPTLAAVGFVAVFAGAANTPISCTLLGIELFGAELAIPLALACAVSYTASGRRGIYHAQIFDTPKRPGWDRTRSDRSGSGRPAS